MDYVKLNKSRHKVKNFDGKKIPTVDVKQIISAASLAPSAHNIQSWHFVIVESEEKRKHYFLKLILVIMNKSNKLVQSSSSLAIQI